MSVGNFAAGFLQAFGAAKQKKKEDDQAEQEKKARVKLYEIQLERLQQEQQQAIQQQDAQKQLYDRMQTMGGMSQPITGQKYSLSDILSDPINASLMLQSGKVGGKDLLAAQQGGEPDAIRTLRALQSDPALLETKIALEKAGAANTTLNLDTQGLTKPPPGFFRPNPAKPGLQLEPGGPAALESTTAEQKRQDAAKTILSKNENVLGNIDDAMKLIGPMTSGFAGAQFAKVQGSPAYNLSKTLQTIKANIGFDRLQEMRAASPTGGALGQVAVQELEALQASIASLDQGLSPDQLKANLIKIQQHYDAWENTVKAASRIDESGASGGASKTLTYDPATGTFK